MPQGSTSLLITTQAAVSRCIPSSTSQSRKPIPHDSSYDLNLLNPSGNYTHHLPESFISTRVALKKKPAFFPHSVSYAHVFGTMFTNMPIISLKIIYRLVFLMVLFHVWYEFKYYYIKFRFTSVLKWLILSSRYSNRPITKMAHKNLYSILVSISRGPLQLIRFHCPNENELVQLSRYSD